MDFLDILTGRYYQTHTGRYFEKMPEPMLFLKSQSDLYKLVEGIDLDYEYVDPTEWHYKTLLNNLNDNESASATIKTRTNLPYKVKGIIALDNGRLCSILSVTEDVSAASREAARILPIPQGTEYVLRLLQIDNPWEV